MINTKQTVLMVAAPEDPATGGAIVALTGHYIRNDRFDHKPSFSKFDIDLAQRVVGNGPHCLSEGQRHCERLKLDPKVMVVTNGWLTAPEWTAEHHQKVHTFYQITNGDSHPQPDYITRVGYKYLVDFLSTMFNPNKAGKSRLDDKETETLQRAFLSARRTVQKDVNDLGHSMTNIRFEDLLIASMAIAMMHLHRTKPKARTENRYRGLSSGTNGWLA